MFNPNIFLMELSNNDVPSQFPFPLHMHLIFAVIAAVFFIYRFITDRRLFQLIMAIAVPFSLTLWIFENRTWFYAVGIIELILVLIAFISSFIDGRNNDETEDNSEINETASDGEKV
ncbi:MAG: hypothetical protein K2J37_07700 [Ruminococcus sp.]|nr:hypothetical protein [Ruminococcus sp.]